MKQNPPQSKGPGRPELPEDQRANSQIQLRVTRKRKAAYVRKASSEKRTLAEWMFQQCDAAANFTPEN